MTPVERVGWQTIRDAVRQRLLHRVWKPGDLIPNEADLAREFGCARSTVNRALRALADDGLLDRKRKAGTRVAMEPNARATFDIALIRAEVEARGQRYGYSLLSRSIAPARPAEQGVMRLDGARDLLRVEALHMADNAPYVLEDRWINLETAAAARFETFDVISANEWLLTHAPYTDGDIDLSAEQASSREAEALACDPGSALFIVERMTWIQEKCITRARLAYAPGYHLRVGLR